MNWGCAQYTVSGFDSYFTYPNGHVTFKEIEFRHLNGVSMNTQLKLVASLMITGTVMANTAPTTVIVSCAMREGTTLMDITYRVDDPDDAVVSAWPLAFVNGVRSFANVMRPSTFREGTEVYFGTNVAANVNHHLVWDLGADHAADKGPMGFEMACRDAEGLIPFEWLAIPATARAEEFMISKNSPTDVQVLNALFYQYATQDMGLSVSADGTVKGSAASGAFSGIELVKGTTLKTYAAPYVMKAMNLQPADRVDVNLAVAANSGILNTTAWHALNKRYSNISAIVVWGNSGDALWNVPLGLANPLSVVSGGSHILVLNRDGTLVMWGSNDFGQCNIPSSATNVIAVAGGNTHSLALKADGTVVAWGYTGEGRCNVPVGLANVVGMGLGEWTGHNLVIKGDGTVVAWGYSVYSQCNIPQGLSNVIAVAAGLYHSIALKSNGALVAWGANSRGQCNIPTGLTNVIAVAAGKEHSVALKRDGTVVAWGYNAQGQCNVPAGLTNVTSIAAGTESCIARKSDGTLVTWGANSFGQCIIPSGLSNVKTIAAGCYHYVATTHETGPQITITFNSQGGSSVGSNTYVQNAMYGTLPTPSRTGYMFAGWFMDAACTIPISPLSLVGTESHTIYAKWNSCGVLRFQKVVYSISENTEAGAVILKVERVGGSMGAVSVSVEIENGTATNDIDFGASPVTLSWADGVSSTKLIAIDLFDDDVYEGNETFLARLRDATVAVIGEPSVTTVTIVDNEGEPAAVARFEGSLEFGNVATNTMATRIVKVWNDGNQPLGVTDIIVPDGFSVSHRSFSVSPGEFFSLSVNFTPTAVASFTGVLGLVCAGNSGASSLVVSGTGIEPPHAVALRTITGLTAIIAVDVPAGANVLSVEDTLLPGLLPLSISHGGIWDALNRKVKWFFDSRADVRDRAVQYTVSGAGSVIMGQVSFGEGGSYPVIGDTIFEAGENPGLLHPADANGDWSVGQSEVSASISRWKNAQEDLKTAVAIRGITLYLQGEQYVYNAAVSAEAKRWIPAGAPLGAEPQSEPLFMAFSVPQSGAVRNVQSNVVTLAVTPPQGTRAYGMEEVVAPGVAVGNISHEGTWDPASRKIRWAFYDGAARTLSYTVSGPEGFSVTLTGLASYDGSEDAVAGATRAVIPLPYSSWALSKGLSGPAASFEACDPARGEANGLLYAFGGNLAEGDLVLDIQWRDGSPVIETPAQDPATAAFVTLAVEGTSSLGAPVWTIFLEPAADQAGVPANRCRWTPVLTAPSSAFFRVRAVLK